MSQQLVHYNSGEKLEVSGQSFISGPADFVPPEVLALLNHPTHRVTRVIIEHQDLNDTKGDKGGFYWCYSKMMDTQPSPATGAESESGT